MTKTAAYIRTTKEGRYSLVSGAWSWNHNETKS